jgi:hypothetical protein
MWPQGFSNAVKCPIRINASQYGSCRSSLLGNAAAGEGLQGALASRSGERDLVLGTAPQLLARIAIVLFRLLRG